MSENFYFIQGWYEAETATKTSWLAQDSGADQIDGNLSPAKFDLEFEAGSWRDPYGLARGTKLTSETKRKIEQLCLRVSDVGAPATWDKQVATLGLFAIRIDRLPAVSAELMELYRSEFPGFFEFIEIGAMWSEHHAAPYRFGPYFLTNLLERRKGWDLDKTEIFETRRGDSSKIYTTNAAKAVVDTEKVLDCPIWRDSTTGNVVCNERFRSVTNKVSLHGWYFYRLRNN